MSKINKLLGSDYLTPQQWDFLKERLVFYNDPLNDGLGLDGSASVHNLKSISQSKIYKHKNLPDFDKIDSFIPQIKLILITCIMLQEKLFEDKVMVNFIIEEEFAQLLMKSLNSVPLDVRQRIIEISKMHKDFLRFNLSYIYDLWSTHEN
jgi:hypothetical protein